MTNHRGVLNRTKGTLERQLRLRTADATVAG